MTETNRKWWILAAGITSLSMIFVDQTALPVALPAIQRELNIGGVMLQWAINAYLLMLATFVVFGGKLGDKYGHKHIFILGQTLFILSSISCALGHSGLWLAVSRGIQGIGGAFMIPATQTIIFNAFDSSERGKAIGFYIGASSIFLIIGPLLGGLLTEHLNWRWIFWVNLPIAILGISLCFHAVPKDRKSQQNPQKIDLLGFFLMSMGLFFLVFSLMESANHGWTSPFIIACMAISIISLFSFIQVERHKKLHPFVDLNIFKNRDYSLSFLIMLCLQSIGIIVIFWIIFLEYVIPVSASKAGAIVIAAQAPITFVAPLAGRIVDRYGPRFAATLGICFTILSFIWIMAFAWMQNYWWLIPGFFIYGSAASLPMFAIMSIALRDIDLEKRGVASGVLNSARMLGNSIGLALLSTIILQIYHSQLAHFLNKAGGILSQLSVKGVEGILASAQTSAKASLLHLNSTQAMQVRHLAVESYIFSFSCIMAVAIAISFIGLLLARKLPGKRQL